MMPHVPGSDDKTPLFMKNLLPEEAIDISSDATSEFDTTVYAAKVAGDNLYRQQKWQEARDAYMRGASLRTSDANLRKLLLLNLAATNLQLGSWDDVLRDTATVLLMDSNSAKALYRSARALKELERPEEAYDCCTRALKLEPHNETIRKEQHTAMVGAIKIHYLLLFKAYVDRRLEILPIFRAVPVGSVPIPQPHEIPYFDPPIPSDPFNAPMLCYVKFRYIERHASDMVTDYSSDKPLIPLLDTFLPGTTTHPPSQTRDNLTYIAHESGAQIIEHPITWDPDYEFLPSTLQVYARSTRDDIISIDGETVSTLDDIFTRIRQLHLDHPDEKGTDLELIRGAVNLFAFRRGSEAERKWLNAEFKVLEDLGDPKYIMGEHANEPEGQRARDFHYGDPAARGVNERGTFSWTAREGILDLFSSRMAQDET